MCKKTFVLTGTHVESKNLLILSCSGIQAVGIKVKQLTENDIKLIQDLIGEIQHELDEQEMRSSEVGLTTSTVWRSML